MEVIGMPRVVAVVSATRGVGRTTVAQNLAVAAAERGQRVCLLDADVGAALRAQAAPERTLFDVAAGRARWSDALRRGPDGVDLLALYAAEHRPQAVLSDAVLLAHVDALETRYDLVLVDLPSGSAHRALFFAGAASEVLLVVMPHEQAVRQAETLVRVLAARRGRHELLVLPNACGSADEAAELVRALQATGTRPPHVRLRPLGWIPTDEAVPAARRARLPVVSATPGAAAAAALVAAAHRLVTLVPSRPTGGAQFFFRSLIAQGRAA
jgi:flagellar biosynthesis protein FlhG